MCVGGCMDVIMEANIYVAWVVRAITLDGWMDEQLNE